MAPNPRAQKNHDELFPNYVSKVAVSDPELVEVFDNFAFDEVLMHSKLEARTRLMVQLASMIACQAVREYRIMLGPAMVAGVTPVEIREIVYQAVPYIGISKVLDFSVATNEFFAERGVALPLPLQATTTPETRYEKGIELQKIIAGEEGLKKMLDAAPPDQLHIHRFLAANYFGDHVSRSGIDLQIRELLTFSMLISLGGCDPQVRGHVVGNLNVGNTRAILIDVVTQLLPYIGYPRTLNALRCVDEAAPL
jgi:4-carboxymuconolactone decarboxylase